MGNLRADPVVTVEDGAFDAFESQLPGLKPLLDRLRAEHRRVAAALTALEADPRTPLGPIADELEAHFAREERELVPVLIGN